MSSLEKKSSNVISGKSMMPLALLAALGGGGYYAGSKALEDYNWRSPFQSPLETKTLSTTKLKEVAKDPATYLTLLALLGGGYGAYKLGQSKAENDIMPAPGLAELLQYR